MSLLDAAAAPESAPTPDAAAAVAPRRPRVVAVILAYNVAPLLEKALRKIPQALVDDIFVMDDGSTDGTGDVARALGLAVYRNERNPRYAGHVPAGLPPPTH